MNLGCHSYADEDFSRVGYDCLELTSLWEELNAFLRRISTAKDQPCIYIDCNNVATQFPACYLASAVVFASFEI